MPAVPLRAPDELVLKVMPPRVPRDLVRRMALDLSQPALAARPLLVVEAPAGFGKTSLLAQWRAELLAQGTAVAWLTVPPQDDPRHFVRALVLSVRTGMGRPRFAQALFEAPPGDALEGVTAWLAEVARLSVPLALMVDEAEQLAPPLHEVLTYLLRNAPGNLRCIVAVRGRGHAGIDDMVAYGSCLKLSDVQLRFSFDETLELARLRFGARLDRDVAARVHDMAEGWPLGVQLALGAAQSAHGDLPLLDLHGGALARQFVGVLLRNLGPVDLDFLVRVSLVDDLHPELAQQLTGDQDAPRVLHRLLRTAPVFQLREQRPWLRMHSLVREALRERVRSLPAGEVPRLHATAAEWLAAQGQLGSAARHALESGQAERAYDLAERGLYEAMVRHGQQGTVQQWLALVPRGQLDQRPRLMLAGAWALASSERHAEAEQLVGRILARHGDDPGLRCECALIQAAAAAFADDYDRYVALLEPWEAAQPLADPLLLRAWAYRRAYRDLLEGEPGLARLRIQAEPSGPPSAFIDSWGLVVLAASYLHEGQPRAAREVLAPALSRADALMGRRSPLACTLAATCADALHDGGRSAEAAAVLADRMDIISRHCGPETLVRAYRLQARLALAAGREDRAIDLLTQMDAVGQSRGWPRVRVVGACELVRLHARGFRGETCRALLAHARALLAGDGIPQGPIWQRGVRAALTVAAGYEALARRQWREAAALFAAAQAAAVRSRATRSAIEGAGLAALAAAELGEDAGPRMRETAELARSLGLHNVLADTHPAVAELARRTAGTGRPPAAPKPPPPAVRRLAATGLADRFIAAAALTPKEREVLELAARSLSNKEIGRALAVGEETVKWHMKNVFFKLDAGSRKQAVAKARIFGLIAETA